MQRSRSIASRHTISFFLLIALPTLIVILLTGYVFRKEIVRITREQRYAALEQIASSLDASLQGFALTASSLIHDKTLMNLSLKYVSATDADTRYRLTLSMDETFNKYLIMTKQMGAFYLFFDDGGKPYVCRNNPVVNFTETEIRAFSGEGAKNPGFVVYLDMIRSGYKTFPQRPIVSLVVDPAVSSSESTGVKSLFVSFDQTELADFLEPKIQVDGKSGEYPSQTFLVARSGIVLGSWDQRLVGRPFSEVREKLGKGYVIMERPVETSGWTIAEAISVKFLTKTVDILMWYVYFALALISILFLGYNTLFFGQIVNPLKNIIGKMDTVAKGNFTVKVEPSEFLELNMLGDSFNLMVTEIDSLTTEIKKEQNERLKVEIEALRYQLNPHFLCNTLNSIRMMAIMTKNDSIKNMTTALMNITEDNLSRDETVYSLEHELRNLDSYVYIMKVRYGDSFGYFTDIDSSLLSLGVPAMILQPLVENAILHGIHGLTRAGAITVAGSRTGDTLRLEVRDNGFGMSEEVRANLFTDIQTAERGFTRIGLYNVMRRIVLAYGSKYGVEVLSYPGDGTIVSLSVPILEVSENIRRNLAEGEET